MIRGNECIIRSNLFTINSCFALFRYSIIHVSWIIFDLRRSNFASSAQVFFMLKEKAEGEPWRKFVKL